MIELVNINKKFKSKELLSNFNYRFKDFGLYVISGKNGSGKTTFLNIISGLESMDSGKIYFNGLLANNNTFFEMRKKEISYIFQNLNLNENLTVEENLKIGFLAGNADLEIFYNKENEILEDLDISKFKFQKVNLLSGGEKTRVAIARALIRGSNIILCDEPTSSLDLENATNVYNILKRLSKKHLIILVSHDPKFINEVENNKYINVINMDKKEETKELAVKENNYRVNRVKQNHIFLRTKYFFKNYIGSSIMFLILLSIILIMVSVFVQYKTQDEYDYYYDYVTENNVDISFLSNRESVLTDSGIDGTSLGFTEHYLDTNFDYTPTLRTLTTSDESFDVLNEDNIYTIFTSGFFDNVVIDNTLNENEIDLTSILYDYAKAYGKIDGSNIQLGNITLKINDVYDIDYSNVNDDTLDDDIGYYNLEYYQKGVYMSYTTFENILSFVPDDGFRIKLDSNNFTSSTNPTYHFYNTSYSDLNSSYIMKDDYSFSDLNDGEIMFGYDPSLIGDDIEFTKNDYDFSFYVLCSYAETNTIIMTYNDYCTLYEDQLELEDQYPNYAIETSNSNLEEEFNIAINNNYFLYFQNSSSFYDNYNSLSVQFAFIYYFFYITLALYFLGLILIILFYKKSNKKNIALLLSMGYSKKDVKIQGMLSNLIFIFVTIPISYLLSRYLYFIIKNKIQETLEIAIIPTFNSYLYIIMYLIAFLLLELGTFLFTANNKKSISKELNE